MARLRQTLYRHLAPGAWEHGLSPLNRVICLLIVLACVAAVVETEASIRDPHAALFDALEATFVVLFSLEYAARVYAAGENPAYAGVAGRLRYVCTPAALVDLVAVLPFYLQFVPFDNAFLLRLVRLARLFVLSRLGRYSQAWQALAAALLSRRHELLLSMALAGMLLLLASACLYVAEGPVQPDKFGSIPRALWWAVATLTTVGYGDVTPITPLGRFFAGVTAVAGIGFIAMPTGILAAAFSAVFHRLDGPYGEAAPATRPPEPPPGA